MTDRTDDFAVQAVAVSLLHMFKGSHFSICTLDNALSVLGRPQGADYGALRALHCVHWSDMPPGMPAQVRERVMAMLSRPGVDLTDLLAQLEAPPVRPSLLARIRGVS